MIAKTTGSDHVVNFLLDPTNAQEFGLGGVAQALELGGIGSDGTVGVIEQALQYASLGAAAGLGGMVIGDIIAGEIEYPKQIAKLQGMYNELNQRNQQVMNATAKLRAGIQQERQAFLASMAKLAQIQAPSFQWQLSGGDTDQAY